LSGNKMGDRGAAAIARSPHLAQLAVLEWKGAGLGDGAGRAFLESPTLGNVVHLNLHGNDFSPAIRDALKKQFGERVMV
jgi:hypothetical protein